MKRIWILLLGCFSLAATAQTVSISVNGNRNERVIVNNVTYDIDNSSINSNKNIVITHLRPGEYSLQLVRVNDFNISDDKVPVKENLVSRTKSTTTFNIRPGFDVAIVILPNGIIQVKDKQVAGTTSDPAIAMPDQAFAGLLNDIRYHWRNTRRITAAQTALTNNNNYFSTAQVIQILQSVDGEDNRLALARLAYGRTVDPGNYIQVYSLMSTPAGRDDLSGFIRQSGGNMIFSFSESFRLEMNEATFEALLQKVKLTIDPGLRAEAVSGIISNTTNYFNVSQVRRLVEMVEAESIRLQLLRDVYTHITDPGNFPLVYNLLGTDLSKIELINHVKTAAENGGLVNYNRNKPAMDEKSFTSVYNNAVEQAGRGNIVAYLTNVFGDFANYFTAGQAAQLISLADGELNRLGLGKAAYRGIVDPENYLALMNELLLLPVTRNELSIYAYSYREP